MKQSLFHALEGKNISFKELSTTDAEEIHTMHQITKSHVLLVGI